MRLKDLLRAIKNLLKIEEIFWLKYDIIQPIMKKSELIFNVISVPAAFLLILLAATIAYFLRYAVETLPVLFDLSYRDYIKLVLAAAPFPLLLFALHGFYTQKSN